MAGIWLLSTRGRSQECQETIDACMEAGMTHLGVVYCDETDYPDLRLPPNWRKHHEPEWRSLQGSLQWCFTQYPDAEFYGWLADDNRPRTHGWDVKLADSAGRWGLSYAADGWQSADPQTERNLVLGLDMTSGLCWGGDVVRAVGWWALPGVIQAGIDTAWGDILRPIGLMRYTPNVLVEHWNWRTGKRPQDEGDSWVRNDVNYVLDDIGKKNEWAAQGGAEAAQSQILNAMRESGDSLALSRALGSIV